MDETDLNNNLDGATSSSKISRNSLHTEVVTQVRDMIVRGDIAPGERLREREICEQLGISRTPLREALKVLAAENMVELLPNRGAQVTQPTVEEIEELFEILAVLEALAGELACVRMTEAEISHTRELHDSMLGRYEEGDRLEYFKFNQQIHEHIMRGSRNSNLQAIYATISGRVRHTRYVSSLTGARWQQAMGEHCAMIRALENRDSPHMFHVLREHLRNKAEAAKVAMIREAETRQPGS
ncbi:MAG: GntR family transcriptional regulator [Halofilum sp. (in: g-proteobacteria)]